MKKKKSTKKKKTPNPVGRPLTKLSDLPKNWKDMILNLAKEGASQVEAMCKLKVGNDLWYRLIKTEKEFSDTIEQAKKLSQSWWEKQGRKNLKNNKFQSSLWHINVRNRFHKDWGDKQEITHKGNVIVNYGHRD